MLFTTGIFAGLVAVGAASPAPTGGDSRGHWSISCDSASKCGYVQSGTSLTRDVDIVARAEADNTLDSAACHVIPTATGACMGFYSHGQFNGTSLACSIPFKAEEMCVIIKKKDYDEFESVDTSNTTGVAVSLLRGDLWQHNPEAPYSTPGAPTHEDIPKGPGGPPKGSSSVSHGPGTPKQSSTKSYAAPTTTSSGYAPTTPAHTGGKPSGGPPHGGKKPTGPPATSSTAYNTPSDVPGKTAHGPESHVHGPKKPGEQEHTGKPGKETSTPAKPTGKPTGGKPTAAKPTGGRSADGMPEHAVPEHAKPAVPGGVSKKPVPYIEFDEAECIDCSKGDACYKSKCFHNGARDIVEICYEKGQKCPDEEVIGYAKPKGQGKPPKASTTGGKPTPAPTPEAEEKKGGW
ncbi:hypothetical protein NX059_011481 [Plenodomus lindquistii]|nr:hypothetical protein NX059_011481 [Plenodomus lindquistii]